jgi:hypothetical protein
MKTSAKAETKPKNQTTTIANENQIRPYLVITAPCISVRTGIVAHRKIQLGYLQRRKSKLDDIPGFPTVYVFCQ